MGPTSYPFFYVDKSRIRRCTNIAATDRLDFDNFRMIPSYMSTIRTLSPASRCLCLLELGAKAT